MKSAVGILFVIEFQCFVKNKHVGPTCTSPEAVFMYQTTDLCMTLKGKKLLNIYTAFNFQVSDG